MKKLVQEILSKMAANIFDLVAVEVDVRARFKAPDVFPDGEHVLLSNDMGGISVEIGEIGGDNVVGLKAAYYDKD